MLRVLLVGLASAVRWGRPSVAPGRSTQAGAVPNSEARATPPPRASEAPSALLTGPFGGLTDDVREFLRCLATDGLLLTGWGDWAPRPELGRLLWHERDALLQELARLGRCVAPRW
jgi:hypothetical protein